MEKPLKMYLPISYQEFECPVGRLTKIPFNPKQSVVKRKKGIMKKVSLMLAAFLVGLISSVIFSYQNANAAEIILPAIHAKYEVSSEDVVYAKPNGLDLLARIYRPKLSSDKPLHAVVDVHPGAWNFYDRLAGSLYNQALAASGIVVVAIDFRQGPTFKHPLASRDVTAAVRFVRVNAEKLGVDADRIGLIGSSAGGHLALLAGIKPNVSSHQGTPILDANGKAFVPKDIDASAHYVIALWPVSDPLSRFHYAKETGRERLIQAHINYFGNEANMADASIQRALKAGEAESLPPVWVVQPGNDKNVPVSMTKELVEAYEAQNGYIEYSFFPLQKHAFAHFPSAETEDCINGMRNFIRRQLQHSTPIKSE